MTLAVLVASTTAWAEPPATTWNAEIDLSRFVPADALVAYWGDLSAADMGSDHVVTRMLRWVELARRLNLIPRRYQAISDIAGSLPVLGEFRHVIMLLDVSSRPVGPEGYRLGHMTLAVVLATGGEHDPVVERIRRLLARYTDKEFGKIEVIDRGKTRSYRLTDSRLPVWAEWEWGALEDVYVVGLGPGAFDRVAETLASPEKNIAHSPWFADATERCKGQGAMIQWFMDYRGIRRRLEPVVKGRPENVLEALGAGKLHRGLATLRMQGRYLVSYVMHEFETGNDFRVLSDPEGMPPEHLRAVPPEASCAIMELDLTDWVARFRDAYLASKTEKERRQYAEWFEELERRTGIDTRNQLLNRLGDHLIVHDWPAHPLQLPLTFTFMLEIDDAAPVRDAIDALLNGWQTLQREFAARRAAKKAATTKPTTRRSRPRTRHHFRIYLGREPDGIWYIQAGIVRPAVAVSDGYIVISWSPEAVRQNLKHLRKVRRAAGPTSTTSAP